MPISTWFRGEIRGQCNRIEPAYQPLVFPESFEGRLLLVIWAPGGDSRPYQAPKTSAGGEREYYVRQGSETVEARGALRSQLFDQTARVPFDDRRNLSRDLDDISETLVRSFLSDVGSDIGRSLPFQRGEAYAKMRLVFPVNAHNAPRNVALLFFADDPDEVFPGARIEVVQFSDDAGGNLIEERIIRGPLDHQIRQTLNYLESLGSVLFEKVPGRAEVDKTVTYPYEAIREAVVNAVYHRSYESVEPTKVYMYPNRIEVISYPGPAQGIERYHLSGGSIVPHVPARNRRIGEFLKELRLAEARGTGIPRIRRRMSENGSPEPEFDFDDERTYFRVVLPAHPRYRVLHSLREGAYMWATGDRLGAIGHLLRAADDQPGSGAIAGQVIEYAAAMDDLDLAKETLDRFHDVDNRTEASQPYLRFAAAMLNIGEGEEARQALANIPSTSGYGDLIEAAILRKRARDYRGAHQIFESIYRQANDDPKVVHEFAQTKAALARATYFRDIQTKRRLNREAAELFRRAIQLTDDPVRKAWSWFDLARTLAWLREPTTDVENAYLQAISLKEDEERFRAGYEQWRSRGRSGRSPGA